MQLISLDLEWNQAQIFPQFGGLDLRRLAIINLSVRIKSKNDDDPQAAKDAEPSASGRAKNLIRRYC